MCYSVGSAMRQGSSSLTRLTGQSARGQFGYRILLYVKAIFDLPERQPVTAGGNYCLGQGAFRR
ncbi:hypothetical protein FEI17_27340 (plasmid) [Kosakonia radicincitans]|nr:hypothetical protein FEI17_27340 [Kosakonia radicincitans]